MSDLTEAQQQAQATLEKVMNCRFSNFDAGAVIHWAERGFYQVKAEAASRLSQQDSELDRMRRELAELKKKAAAWDEKDGIDGAACSMIREMLDQFGTPRAAFIDDHVANGILHARAGAGR